MIAVESEVGKGATFVVQCQGRLDVVITAEKMLFRPLAHYIDSSIQHQPLRDGIQE